MRGFIVAAISGAVFLMLGVTPNPVQAHLVCDGAPVSGSVTLDEDLACVDEPGLIVGAAGTTIHMKNFTIACTGSGLQGSCQGVAGAIGIDAGGFSNVLIKGVGTIDGFDIGVLVNGGVDVNVRRLVVTGPVSLGAGNNNRGAAVAAGILVQDTDCPVDFETIINIHGNDVSNHRDGIKLIDANCVNVGKNNVHNNNDDPVPCHGIVLIRSDNNNINGNSVTENGENAGGDSGIDLQQSSDNNTVVGNDASDNCGDGIRAVSVLANVIVNNEMRGNPFVFPAQCFGPIADADANDTGSPGDNNWNDNNDCITSKGAVPATVCNPGE